MWFDLKGKKMSMSHIYKSKKGTEQLPGVMGLWNPKLLT